MSMQPPAGPQRVAPAFIASNVRFGKIGDGEQLAVGFLFSDSSGAEYPPIVLTNELGVLGPELAEIFTKLMTDIAPPEEVEVPIVHCGDCGVRIFGEVAERGQCLTCERGKDG